MGDMHGTEGMAGMGGMMASMVIWGLGGLALLVLAVAATFWFARRSDPSRHAPSPESPEEALRRRYAAGQLDEDEYLRRRAGLKG